MSRNLEILNCRLFFKRRIEIKEDVKIIHAGYYVRDRQIT
jgi:hypothetical protein